MKAYFLCLLFPFMLTSIDLSMGVKIPEKWRLYLVKLTSQCYDINFGANIICPPSPYVLAHQVEVGSKLLTIEDLILPYVILWDPLNQYSSMLKGLKCETCMGALRKEYWKQGQSLGNEPRLIHDIEHTIIVAIAVYVCQNGHITSGTNPLLLQLMDSEHIPFILLHRTGFSKILVRSVLQLVSEGLTMSGIERYFKKMRREFGANLLKQVIMELKRHNCNNECLNLSSFPLTLLLNPTPSDDTVYKCVMVDFLRNRELYDSQMQQLSAHSFISLDHTFKVAANIGYKRADGKWVTEYGSAFFVMNELGQVLCWQLTKSTSIDEVSSLLKKLNDRLSPHSLLVVVDNCCSLRGKLAHLFGPDVIIKLDLFHAVQRLTKHMPKRHPYHFQCMKDLKLVFRDPTDLGAHRTKSTPASDQIITNLDHFVEKWKNIVAEHWTLINTKVMKEVASLKVHINRKCLSGLPSKSGTNHNEALHRILNTHFSKVSRIGIPLALALLTVILYQHNSKIKEKVTGISCEPIELLHTPQRSTSEHFGIIPKDSINKPHWLSCKLEKSILSFDFSIICLTDRVLELATISEIKQMIENAIRLTHFAECLELFTASSPLFDPRFLPFMSSVSNVFLHDNPEKPSEDECEHKERLDRVLTAWGLKVYPICGDGNCCFTAVAMALIMNASSILEVKADFFTNLAISTDNCASLSKALRMLAVEEWKNNESYYRGFLLSDASVAEEAEKFLQNGFFTGELGDTMVLALSNVLNMPITVLSSIRGHPIVNTLPRKLDVSYALFITYNQYGPGHYDAVTSIEGRARKHADDKKWTEMASTTHQKSNCSCGKNDKGENAHCHPIQRKYTTVCHCPCLKDNKGCSVYCKCKRCNNPLGVRTVATETSPLPKKPRHSWQKSLPTSYSFAAALKEKIERGTRTLMEYLALEQVLSHLQHNRIEVTVENMEVIYQAIVEISTDFESTLPLGMLTTHQILKFLSEHEHNLKLYENLCIAELRVNQ